jgi:hypothetical protein
MNEYTYEIWSKYRKDNWEFFRLESVESINANDALKKAEKSKNNQVMQGIFSYQIRNLKKL